MNEKGGDTGKKRLRSIGLDLESAAGQVGEAYGGS